MENQIKGLALLRQPFSKNQISLLPKPTKKDNPKGKCDVCKGWHGLPAVHLEYVGHAALTDRLLEADPEWNWSPLTLADGLPGFDKTGGLWIKLTVCGVTRLGYGHAEGSTFKDIGSREKEVIGDALRNAAMRFGAALDLWHKGDLHGDAEDETSEGKTNIAKSKPDQAKKPETKTKPENKQADGSIGKIEVGAYTGQTFDQVLKVDSAVNYRLARWADIQMTDGKTIHPSYSAYLKYALAEGVEL